MEMDGLTVVRRSNENWNSGAICDVQKCFSGSLSAVDCNGVDIDSRSSTATMATRWAAVSDRDGHCVSVNRIFKHGQLKRGVFWADFSMTVANTSSPSLPRLVSNTSSTHQHTVALTTTAIKLAEISVIVICNDVKHAAALIGCCDDVTALDANRLVNRLLCGRGVLAGSECVFNCSCMPLARRFGIHSLNIRGNISQQLPNPTEQRSIVGLMDDKTHVSIERVTTTECEVFFRSCYPMSGHQKARRCLRTIFSRWRSSWHSRREVNDRAMKYCSENGDLTSPMRSDQSELYRSGGVLILGPSGCGKATLVRSAAQQQGFLVLDLCCPELAAVGGDGDDGLQQLFTAGSCYWSAGQPVVLLLRSVDQLVGPAAVHRLLYQLSARVPVVVTASRPEGISARLRCANRFPVEIHVNIGTSVDRREYLHNLLPDCRPSGLNSAVVNADKNSAGDLIDEIADITVGYTVADLKRLIQEVFLSKSMTSSTADVIKSPVHSAPIESHTAAESALWDIRIDDIRAAMRTITPSPLKGVAALTNGASVALDWRHLAGVEAIRERLERCLVAPLCRVSSAQQTPPSIPSPPVPRGLLLHGPPGCAKTSLVRAVVASCRVAFLSVVAADVYSPYVGDAEKAIRELFTHARMVAPCVIFFDELDALVGTRSRSLRAAGVQAKVLSALLNEMDGVGIKEDHIGVDCPVFVVGATNRRDLIDEALLRPGRLDQHIEVPLPDLQARLKILALYTGNTALADDVSLSELASLTVNCSGADIKQLCNQAALNALTEDMCAVCVFRRHFMACLTSR